MHIIKWCQVSSVSLTETDINTRLVKAWTAINRLSVIWKSVLTDKIKQFLPSSGRVDTAIWMHYMDANITNGEKPWRKLHKNAASNIEGVMETALHKAAAIQTPTTHHENYQLDEPDMQDTAREVRTNS